MKPFEKLHLPDLPTEKATSLLDEFKGFAFKGNVVDLAVGVIIGGAFGTIVKSLVDNILMPLLAYVTPKNTNYQTWELGPVHFGRFLGDVVNFLIVAAALFFFIVKFLGWLMRTKKEEQAEVDATPAPTPETVLLTEIRDLLRDRGSEQVAKHGVGQE